MTPDFIEQWKRNAKNNPKALAGIEKLVSATQTPEFILQQKVLQTRTDSLTQQEKDWFRHTQEGRKEIWRRVKLCGELCAKVLI